MQRAVDDGGRLTHQAFRRAASLTDPSNSGTRHRGVSAYALEELGIFVETVIPLTEKLQVLQCPDGSIAPDQTRAAGTTLNALANSLVQLPRLLGPDLVEAFRADAAAWCGSGLDSAPQFDHVRQAVRPPEDGALAAFVGPVFLPNSGDRSPRVRAFAVLRDEPAVLDALSCRYPHPRNVCQSTRFLVGSAGVRDSNNVVFFPENIPASTACDRQNFAWFFFNKHWNIYRQTLQIVDTVAGPDPFAGLVGLPSQELSREAFYTARCVWGYLHDFHHHSGPRPLDENLALKTEWCAGVLEELKVDLRSAVDAVNDPEIPFGRTIFEWIILERCFRYPREPDGQQNADAASGCILLEFLLSCGAATVDHDRLRLAHPAELAVAVRGLAADIEGLESLTDSDYAAAVDGFVFEWLERRSESPSRSSGPRFEPGDRYRKVARSVDGLMAYRGGSDDE